MSGRQRVPIPDTATIVDKGAYGKLVFLHSEVHRAGDKMLGVDNGGTFETFTCEEAEALADVFAAAGRQDVHDFIIDQHGAGDYDNDDTHHQIYLDKKGLS